MTKDGQSDICEIRLGHKQRRNALSHSNECADRNTNSLSHKYRNIIEKLDNEIVTFIEWNIATGPRPVHFFTERLNH